MKSFEYRMATSWKDHFVSELIVNSVASTKKLFLLQIRWILRFHMSIMGFDQFNSCTLAPVICYLQNGYLLVSVVHHYDADLRLNCLCLKNGNEAHYPLDKKPTFLQNPVSPLGRWKLTALSYHQAAWLRPTSTLLTPCAHSVRNLMIKIKKSKAGLLSKGGAADAFGRHLNYACGKTLHK